jgi:hypothetical protein
MAITPNTEGSDMGIPAITFTPGPRGWCGYKAHRKAQATGTTIVLVDGKAAGMDTDAGRWSLVCDDHGSVCAFTHQHDARAYMARPADWCECCAADEAAA